MRKLDPAEKARRKRAQDAAYYARNRDKILAKNQEPEQRAILRAKSRAYYAANADNLRARRRAYVPPPEVIERNRARDRARNKTDPRRGPRARRAFFAEYRARPETQALYRAWRDANKDRVKENRMAKFAADPRLEFRYRLTKYHLTLESFDAMVIAQCGKCAICLQPPKRGEFHVDHDAQCCPKVGSCGKCIRGLLCANCNTMLGLAKESRDTLTRAIEYLNHPFS